MLYYLICKSTNRHLNAIFYWKLAQLLMGGIIVEKLRNKLWRIFSYADNMVTTPKQATRSTSCNIAPVLLFRFIISYIFLYNVVLFLFGWFHFWWRKKVWVQVISVRWVIQNIGLLIYIYCVPQTITLIFLHCTVIFFNEIIFLVLNFMLAVIMSKFGVHLINGQ